MLLGWYAIIFSFFIWIKKRKFSNIMAFVFSILVLQSVYIYNKFEVINSDEFIVFNKNKTTLLSDRKSNEMMIYTNDSVIEKDFLIRSYKIGSFSKIIKTDSLQHLY